MNTTLPAAPKVQKYSTRRTRKIIQWALVIAAFLIGLRHILPGEASGAFDSFCAMGGIETLLPYALRGETLKTTNLLNFSFLLGVVGTALVAGRAFCGWLCPLGAVQDGLASAARRLTGEKRHIPGKKSPARLPLHLPAGFDRPMRYTKYLILAAVLVVSTFAAYPPLRDICPLRAVFGLKLTPLLWVVMLVFLGSSLLVERFTCKYLCPLGGALAAFNKISPVHLKSGAGCNHCGRCDVECSMGIDAVPENLSDPECVRCLECLETCSRKEGMELRAG